MDFLTAIPAELPEFNQIKNLISKPGVHGISGCVPSQMEQMMAALSADFKYKVIISHDEQRCREILGNYMAYERSVFYYPAIDPMFFKADIHGTFISEQRLEVMKALVSCEPVTVITTPEAFDEKIASSEQIEKSILRIQKGGNIDTKELSAFLTRIGYENESQVETHGEYSIRGNIIDIFPFGEEAPYRIDLWGDEVESISYFDPESQRSIENVDEFTIFPGADNLKTEVYLMDYFKPDCSLFMIDEPARVFKDINIDSSQTADKSDGLLQNDVYNRAAVSLAKQLKEKHCITFSLLNQQCDVLKPAKVIAINTRSIPSYNGRLTDLTADLKKRQKNKWRTLLLASSQSRAKRLVSELAENNITAFYDREKAAYPKPGSIMISCSMLKSGFEYPDLKTVVMTESDLFGERRVSKRKKKKYTGDIIRDFSDLNIGDYVVHINHGIGIYRGIERIKIENTQKDFLKVEYAKGASLYVPATQLDRLQKYASEGTAAPKLNRLGGKEWTATKARVRAAVKDIAQDLVKLYAERSSVRGHMYPPDTEWQKEFEDRFEFELTDDQKRAVEDVKRDMESPHIMERLICGDVGFGKTEVALRAAFKAVQDNKQVVFLAPTTILARQHYETIVKRMANYPVNIRMLSRFVPASEQKTIIKELSRGEADITVGTHRLLSSDIEFKNLGLLIIDEEQRFGVAHKEKIKQLKKDVDVLMLSATPIPRTLHMSLSGIRDMSLLTEPPIDRLPIQTYVMEYSDEAVREAILREVRRGGQVYYVYNRINNIDYIADKVASLVPGFSVRTAHGKMSSRELEDIMHDFTAGEIDVLVSTTIIETGLDISNVNTIIIHDADRFGLSQLYQLRGRVGRSGRTAYAFLMYRGDRLLREVAENRLKAIREFSDLGSGVKIAMKDLEIRGAGNILGAEQSGHMEAVGYELYSRLLNQAVMLLKGEDVSEDYETTIDLSIDGYIPSEYIKNEFVKLGMYKRIAVISNRDELEDILDELKDRFGPVPKPVGALLAVALMKARAHDVYITEISGGNGKYKIGIFKHAKVDVFKMSDFLNKYEGRLKFVNEANPYFRYEPPNRPKTTGEIMNMVLDFSDRFEEILEK